LFFFTSNETLSAGLSIQPIKISHTMKPGETVTGVISLSDATSEVSDGDIILQTKVEDFAPTAGTEMYNFVGRAKGVTTVRDWIKLDVPEELTLKAGEGKEISYTITAPLNAEPGGHFGVMFFKVSNKPKEGMQMKIGTQIGVLIFVTIPGNHLQKGAVHGFSAPSFIKQSPVTFGIDFENTGTVHFEPKGKILVTSLFGRTVAEIPVEGQVVLPTGRRQWIIGWNYEGMLLGRYKATLQIVDPDGEQLDERSVSFYAAPVWFVVEFFASVIVLYTVIRFLKKKIRITIVH